MLVCGTMVMRGMLTGIAVGSVVPAEPSNLTLAARCPAREDVTSSPQLQVVECELVSTFVPGTMCTELLRQPRWG